MYQYRQIIFRLRQGDSIRGIAQAKLAGRNKIRQIRDVAMSQGWLSMERDLPNDEALALFCGSLSRLPQQPLALPYKAQIETWVKQGIQASTIHAALQRQHAFTGSYNSIQRLVKRIKDDLQPVSIMLDFQPGECAQVDFGAGPKLIDSLTGLETKTWIFVMVLAWSRHMYAEIVLR
jgi:hypothetical protein